MFDYMIGTIKNNEYWSFEFFWHLNKGMYELIESFVNIKPLLWPHHVCDLMFAHDNIYIPLEHIRSLTRN
jgi:hypothetical protein